MEGFRLCAAARLLDLGKGPLKQEDRIDKAIQRFDMAPGIGPGKKGSCSQLAAAYLRKGDDHGTVGMLAMIVQEKLCRSGLGATR